jgi:hypothetical protein
MVMKRESNLYAIPTSMQNCDKKILLGLWSHGATGAEGGPRAFWRGSGMTSKKRSASIPILGG